MGPPAERKLRRSRSLKQVTFVEESPAMTPARVKSAGSVLHREEHKETPAEAEKRLREKKAKERKREAEKFWRRFQKDMFESEAERIDVAPDVVENVYRESDMRMPFYLPEAYGTPCSLEAWPLPGPNRSREYQGPTTPPHTSLLAHLPALLALLLYALGQMSPGPAVMALLCPAAINPWFTIAKIQLENRDARARKTQNIVV